MIKLWHSPKNLAEVDEIPVVLLHGFLESSTMWKHLQFPENYPVVCVDLPGHGQSNGPEVLTESIEEMATRVVNAIEDLELNQYHIIGHSMGGYVALEMKRMDARAAKVMLLNSNFWSDSPQKVKDRMRVAKIVQTNKPHFIYEVIPNLFLNPEQHDHEVKSIISEAQEISSEAIAKSSIAMSRRKNYSGLVRANPSLFSCIQGNQDSIVPVDRMRNLAAEYKFDYTELENVGHMAHIEAPMSVNKLVESFLKGE